MSITHEMSQKGVQYPPDDHIGNQKSYTNWILFDFYSDKLNPLDKLYNYSSKHVKHSGNTKRVL